MLFIPGEKRAKWALPKYDWPARRDHEPVVGGGRDLVQHLGGDSAAGQVDVGASPAIFALDRFFTWVYAVLKVRSAVPEYDFEQCLQLLLGLH